MAHIYRGDIFFRTNRFFDAYAYYRQAKEITQEAGGLADFQSEARIGDVLFQMGDLNGSLESFERVLSLEARAFEPAGFFIHYRSRVRKLILGLLIESRQDLTPLIIRQTEELVGRFNQTVAQLFNDPAIDHWTVAEAVFIELESTMRENWQY